MREDESEVEILGTMGPVIDENLVRAQGSRTRVGAGQGAMGGTAEGPGQEDSSTCGPGSGGIQRVKFRMQEWGGAVLGEKLPLDEGQEQVPARGGGRRVGVKWGTGLPPGARHCAQGPGIIGRRAPPGDDIGQRVEGKIHG